MKFVTVEEARKNNCEVVECKVVLSVDKARAMPYILDTTIITDVDIPKKRKTYKVPHIKVVPAPPVARTEEVEPEANTPEWVRYWIPRFDRADEKKKEVGDYLHAKQLELKRGFCAWCEQEIKYSLRKIYYLIEFSINYVDSQVCNSCIDENKAESEPETPDLPFVVENKDEVESAQNEEEEESEEETAPKRRTRMVKGGYKEVKNKRPSVDFNEEPDLWEWIDTEARDYDKSVGKTILELLKELKHIKDSLGGEADA